MPRWFMRCRPQCVSTPWSSSAWAGTRMVRKARKALDAAGVAHQYLEYGSYFSEWRRRNALKMWTGWPTFPMVFVKGQLVGGASDLAKLIASGELKRLLGQCAGTAVRGWLSRGWVSVLAVALCAAGASARRRGPAEPCRVAGIRHQVLCGQLERPLEAPARPDGVKIDVHFVVVPALARRKLPDPVFFLPAGRGRAPSTLAGSVCRCWRASTTAATSCSSTSAAPAAPRRWSATTTRHAAAGRHRPTRSASCAHAARCRQRCRSCPTATCASYDHADGDAGPRRGAPGAGRRAHQPGRRVVRHARRARLPAPVSAGGAPCGARWCGAARHGVAAASFDRRPDRVRCPAARL